MKEIKLKNMSYSSFDLYNECPRKFYFKKILNMSTPPSVASNLGQAIHWLLRRYYMKEDIAPDKNYSEDVMKISQKLMEFYESKYKYLDNFKVLGAEKRFAFKRKGVEWHGVIDMIIEREGQKIIVDHKYSSRRFKESFIALTFQGALYYYYLKYIANIEVKSIIWNTIFSPAKLLKNGEPSTTIDFVRFETKRNEIEIENMWAVIDETMNQIQKKNYLPHISRRNCETCPYIEQCIAVQKGLDI